MDQGSKICLFHDLFGFILMVQIKSLPNQYYKFPSTMLYDNEFNKFVPNYSSLLHLIFSFKLFLNDLGRPLNKLRRLIFTLLIYKYLFL